MLQNGVDPDDTLLGQAGMTRAEANGMKAQVTSGGGGGTPTTNPGTNGDGNENPGTNYDPFDAAQYEMDKQVSVDNAISKLQQDLENATDPYAKKLIEDQIRMYQTKKAYM